MSERKQDKHASTAGQPRGLGSKNPKQGEEMIGAQAVVASLEAEGVDLVFGYPGGQAIKIYDALYDSKQLHHVLSRHEQGAVHEADGYARATGNVGVVIVTSGPGATNTVTGIATAYMDSVPLVVITGQVPRGVIGTDSFQESDIVGITMPVVKHSFLLQSTDELTSTFREAFHIAASGRPGPVLIDIPSDILSEKMVFNYPDKVNLPSYRPTYRGNAKQIRAAVQRIQRAERPVLYVGGGVISSGAADELVELANALQLPVVTTLMGKGAFPASNPLNIGPVGMHGSKYANLAMTESDLIIACGARFSDRVTGKLSEFAPHADVIHIDIDPAEIGKIRKVQIPIVGDLRGVLAGINEAVAKAGAKPITAPWLAQIAEWRRRFPFYHSDLVEDPGRIVPETVMQKLSRKLDPKHSIVVTEVGQHQMWAAQFIDREKSRTFISPRLGHHGLRLPGGYRRVFFWLRSGRLGGLRRRRRSLQMNSQRWPRPPSTAPVKVLILTTAPLAWYQWQKLFYKRALQFHGAVGQPRLLQPADAQLEVPPHQLAPEEVDAALDEMPACEGPFLLDVPSRRPTCSRWWPRRAAMSDARRHFQRCRCALTCRPVGACARAGEKPAPRSMRSSAPMGKRSRRQRTARGGRAARGTCGRGRGVPMKTSCPFC